MVSISISDAFHAMLDAPGPMAYEEMSISARADLGCLRPSKVVKGSKMVYWPTAFLLPRSSSDGGKLKIRVEYDGLSRGIKCREENCETV